MTVERRREAARAAREAALAALSERRNVTRAARAAGRCRQTLHEWLREPEFRAGLERRREARARDFFACFASTHAVSELVLRPSSKLLERLHVSARHAGADVETVALAALQRGLQDDPQS